MNNPRQHNPPAGPARSPDAVSLLVARDLLLLVYLPLMATIAWCVPERLWPGLCRRLAALTTRLRVTTTAERRDAMRHLLSRDVDALLRSLVAHHHLARIQTLRWYRIGGWHPRIRLSGREHIDAALLAGKGAVLWAAPLAFNDVVTKMALYQAGFAVSHLSRIEHGFSTSRLGARLLNPIWTTVERRYLANRLVMAPGQSAGALRELLRRVRANQLVSIALGSQGLRTHTAPFLNGTIRIADGAPSLAQRTGAALLPVFTVRLEDGSFETTVEPPLAAPPDLSRDDAIHWRIAAGARRLASYVRRWPDQFQSWHSTTPAADPP